MLPLTMALPMEFDGEEAIPFRNVFPGTPSGKVELDGVDTRNLRPSWLRSHRHQRAASSAL